MARNVPDKLDHERSSAEGCVSRTGQTLPPHPSPRRCYARRSSQAADPHPSPDGCLHCEQDQSRSAGGKRAFVRTRYPRSRRSSCGIVDQDGLALPFAQADSDGEWTVRRARRCMRAAAGLQRTSRVRERKTNKPASKSSAHSCDKPRHDGLTGSRSRGAARCECARWLLAWQVRRRR
ncbi:hypothetical protein BJ912DRAFT_990024 [Pholiota molesta]|nr:hypothetical protein BJ912DRAFT_990024 [Pholiota molesta]